MKKNNIIYLLMSFFICFSCEDALEEKITGEWENTDVWRIPEMAEGVLMKAYASIAQMPDNYGNNFLDAATDNALTNNFGSSVYKLSMGALSATNNPIGNWSSCYENLQYVNEFLEKGLSDNILYNRVDEDVNAQIKQRLEGEAYFLRAWWSFQLLMQYGGKTDTGEALGYPIVTRFITEEEAKDKEKFRRNTYQECVEQIIKDCNDAIRLLPETYTGSDPVTGDVNIGRASKLSAAVLKSRVALYGASPAYQPDNVTQITGMGSFAISDAGAYQKKWEYAALVSDTILRRQGYGTFVALKAADLADGPNATPKDFVFRKYFNNRGLETRHFPPSYFGTAQTVPSQNLVDAFPAKNGFPVTDSRANISTDNPYASRDNRLDLNVYYQGRKFGTSGDPINVIKGGRDSQEFHPNGSRSGYYLAKYISKKDNMLNPTLLSNVIHYQPLLRKAEVFLNFAEAANEAWGPTGKDPLNSCKYTAYDVIKLVRQLSGGITNTAYLDEMAADKETFRRLIQNERRLEFAFENQRYYDMRRWLLTLNKDVEGIEVKNENSSLIFTRKTIEPRKFDDIRFYYAPLPYDEVVKNKNLINNLGWK